MTLVYGQQTQKSSLYNRFMDWCDSQQKNRLLWLGLTLTAHGCVITPLTILMVLLAGTNLYLFIMVLAAMGASLVTNLAALPTRITIPVFFLTLVIDIAIIFSCVFIGLDIAKTYV